MLETQKTVSFHTLGCRLNMAETGHIVKGFEDRGYKTVDFGEKADVVMVNTCTVTDQADSTCRNLISKAYRSSPEGKIVVVGCYSQMEPEKISKMKGVDLVLGTAEKFKIFDYLDEETENKVHVDMANDFWGANSSLSDGHTRSFLKIQDGCNYICSFCIIPQARGRSKAITLPNALKNAQNILDQGYKEIVLTGVNIGEYEKASGTSLPELVSELLKLDRLKRLRLSSVEPNTISDELINVLKSSDKVLNHFHIPLQSGSDKMLNLMRRKYNTAFYEETVMKIIESFPNAAIGADIILGHPGEDEEDFQKTFNLLRKLPITHFHAFPFSKRKNTLSAKMEDQIPHHVKKERVKIINSLGQSKLSLFAEDQVGQINNVLFERRNKSGNFEGYTTNFVKVEVESLEDLKNQIIPTKIISAKNGLLFGQIK